jgi:hypothetical protein
MREAKGFIFEQGWWFALRPIPLARHQRKSENEWRQNSLVDSEGSETLPTRNRTLVRRSSL